MLWILRPYRPLWTTSICDRVNITNTMSSSNSSTGGISRLLNIAHHHLPCLRPFQRLAISNGTDSRYCHLPIGDGTICFSISWWCCCRVRWRFCQHHQSTNNFTLIIIIIIITRNTFCGTWYLPHSRVHKSILNCAHSNRIPYPLFCWCCDVHVLL